MDPNTVSDVVVAGGSVGATAWAFTQFVIKPVFGGDRLDGRIPAIVLLLAICIAELAGVSGQLQVDWFTAGLLGFQSGLTAIGAHAGVVSTVAAVKGTGSGG